MLERIQRTRIDVEVGIEFLDGYGKAASLEHGTKRCRSKPFAERGKNSARDENESGFSVHISSLDSPCPGKKTKKFHNPFY